jgi:hypothetical protein
VKLGELWEAVSVKLAGIGLTAGEAEVALEALFVITGLVHRNGRNAVVRDWVDPAALPDHMASMPLARYLLSLPFEYDNMVPRDVVTVAQLAVLVAGVQAALDDLGLISTATGPVPRPRSI